MAVIELTGSSFDEAISSGKCLVDFWATWCGPCRMQAPIIAQLAEAHPDVKACKVNVDEQPMLASRFNVMSIPTIVYFQDGRMTGKAVGVQSIEQLKAGLEL